MSQSLSRPIYFVQAHLANDSARQENLLSGTCIDSKTMSPSTEDNLGRRRFLLHREKAVEQAVERIRRFKDSGWETLSSDQRTDLRKVLAEIWENCEHNQWEQYCFSTLTRSDILRLVSLGNDVRAQHRQICDIREEIGAILLSCSTGS